MKIAYLHGLESSINEKDPKIIFMRANFKEVYAPSINYRDEKTFDKLFSDIKRLKPDLIIGSSMGGYVSYLIGSKLGIETILFNPAVEDRSFDPVVDESGMKKSKHNVYLGKSDNVVSGKAVRNYFKKHAIGSFTYTEYEGGHRVPEDEFIRSIEQVTKIYKENIDNPKVMKRIKLYEEFLNENYQVNEAMIAAKDWDRMISLVLKGDDGERVSKSIKNKEKATARFVAGLKLSNSELKQADMDTSYPLSSSMFRALGQKALELGATPDEIQNTYDNAEVPQKYLDKITKMAGKKLQDSFAGPISKVILDLGLDINYQPHNGYAITYQGKDAMNNGRKWTIGYKSKVTLSNKEVVEFDFDVVTDEGGGTSTYVLANYSNSIFDRIESGRIGIKAFKDGLTKSLNKQ
jgi:hypothetical protein